MCVQICLPMTDPPPAESELGFRLSPTVVAAWHVLGMLLSRGRPAQPSDLASSFWSFRRTPDFIRFLCSIPESPLRIAENQSVTISEIGVAAIAQFVANSDVIARCVNTTGFLPRLLPNARSYDIVWTYCRKRKRLSSTTEHFPQMKRRCYSQGCDELQNLNRMSVTMPGEFRNAHSQGIETCSSLSSPSVCGSWEPKSIIFGTTVFSKLHSGQLDYEIENIDSKDRMEAAFLTIDGHGHSRRKRYKSSDFLFQGRLPHIQRTVVAEEMVDSYPHPKISIEHTMVKSEGSCICNIDVVNIVKSNSICSSPGLEVDEMNISQTGKKKTGLQMCESSNEDDRRRKEILLHDFGRCRGCKENHSAKAIIRDVDETNPEQNLVEPNIVGLHVVTPRKVHLLSQGHTLNHLTQSTSMSKRDKKNEINDRKKAISLTRETCKYLPGKKLEQVRRDKVQTSNKPKPKCNSDQNSNTKEREASIEQTKKCHSEQKPFPNFELFIVEEEEGSGGYGTVYRARRKTDGVPFAIKCPHANANLNYVHNELKMLERLGGKDFVIKYEGSLKSGSNDCLVLEHVDHDRPEILKREINVIQLQWYGYCLFKALAGLHKQGIVHRDVKPGNFLFSRKVNKGYLIDFNLALDMSKKHGTIAYNSRGRQNQNDRIPGSLTKSLPPERNNSNKKIMNTKLPDAVNKNAGKVSKSVLIPVDLKKRVGRAAVITDTSSKNSIRSQGAEVSGITSARDATRTPSAERMKEPLPSQGRKELLSLVQEAMHGANHKSANAPTSKRKRVVASSRDVDSKCFYPTPMPLSASGLAVGSTGLPKGKADVKRKRDGPCAGTKGFKAPEVLFRSMHQGLKTDIWSAGVTLLYLMIGRTPFVGDTDQNIKEISKLRGSEDLWEVAKLHDRESSFPLDLLDIKYLSSVKLQDWCAQNTRRPDFLETIPRSLYDLVDRCLTVNPRQRISAEEALRHEFFMPCHEVLRKQKQQDKVHS